MTNKVMQPNNSVTGLVNSSFSLPIQLVTIGLNLAIGAFPRRFVDTHEKQDAF